MAQKDGDHSLAVSNRDCVGVQSTAHVHVTYQAYVGKTNANPYLSLLGSRAAKYGVTL